MHYEPINDPTPRDVPSRVEENEDGIRGGGAELRPYTERQVNTEESKTQGDLVP